MLNTLLAWALVALLLPSAYPLARRLLTHSPAHDGPILTWTLALGLSVGGLTLTMFWLSMLGIAFTPISMVAAYGLLLGAGHLVLRAAAGNPQPSEEPDRSASTSRLSWFAPLMLGAIAAVVLFNAAYWPFSRNDVLGIYQPLAFEMTALRGVLPLIGADSLYRAYPMLIPLSYTFGYIVSGWDNQYVARIMPTLLSLGSIPIAYLLARRSGGARAGWLAALLVAFAPTFSRWVSTGYADLPMGFYYGLGAVFALRLWTARAPVDALLLGLMIGLAAWTKNSALVGIPGLILWLGWAWLHQRVSPRGVLLALIACAAVALPWYIRNLIGAGFLLPDTAWVDQAQRTLASALVYLTRPSDYGVVGWAIAGGLSWLAWRWLRAPRDEAGSMVILLWFAPFFLAWWLFASYDPRFLLSVLAVVCAAGGLLLARLWDIIPERPQKLLRPVLIAASIGWTLVVMYFSLEYKDSLLRAPLMSDAEKRYVVLYER